MLVSSESAMKQAYYADTVSRRLLVEAAPLQKLNHHSVYGLAAETTSFSDRYELEDQADSRW